MSDTPEPTPPTAPTEVGVHEGANGGRPDEHDLAVDLAAFLPDGVTLGEPEPEPEPEPETEPEAGTEPSPVDTDALAQVERDLDAVDAAIAALDAGTYGTDPATGQPIPDHLLAEDPTRLS